jgi:hypothetical protein
MKNAGRWDMWAKKATLTSDCTHPCCLVKGAWSYVCAMKDNVTEDNRAGFGNDLSGIKKKKETIGCMILNQCLSLFASFSSSVKWGQLQ